MKILNNIIDVLKHIINKEITYDDLLRKINNL